MGRHARPAAFSAKVVAAAGHSPRTATAGLSVACRRGYTHDTPRAVGHAIVHGYRRGRPHFATRVHAARTSHARHHRPYSVYPQAAHADATMKPPDGGRRRLRRAPIITMTLWRRAAFAVTVVGLLCEFTAAAAPPGQFGRIYVMPPPPTHTCDRFAHGPYILPSGPSTPRRAPTVIEEIQKNTSIAVGNHVPNILG